MDLYLEQRRPVSVASTSDGLSGGVGDGDGVVSIHASAVKAESVGALGTVLDVGDARFGHADGPVVVLDNEDDGEVLDAREVERLEECALIDRALAEERDRDAVGVPLLCG